MPIQAQDLVLTFLQRKKAKMEAAAAGQGEWHERARKQPRPDDKQSAANLRRAHQRQEHTAYIRDNPWSPQKRDAFYERPRQFRYVLLDEGKEITFAVSQNGAYVGGHGPDKGIGCNVSEEEALAAGLVKVPYDGRCVGFSKTRKLRPELLVQRHPTPS